MIVISVLKTSSSAFVEVLGFPNMSLAVDAHCRKAKIDFSTVANLKRRNVRYCRLYIQKTKQAVTEQNFQYDPSTTHLKADTSSHKQLKRYVSPTGIKQE